MESSRGQAALEYLIIFAVIFLAVVALAFIATQNTELARTTSEISAALQTISSTADSVYALGPGSSTTLNTFLPTPYDRTQASFYGKELILPVYIQGILQESLKNGKAEIKGNPPKNTGLTVVKFRMTSDGYVLINDAKAVEFPAYYSISLSAGSGSSNNVTVKNLDTASHNLNLVKSGSSWVTLSTSNLGNIAPGANATFQVLINPPGGTSAGLYLSYVSVVDASTSEEYSWIPVRVRVS